VWLRIGTGGELLRMQQSTFGFHKMLGNNKVSYLGGWLLRELVG
jgi:hypothetical protein